MKNHTIQTQTNSPTLTDISSFFLRVSLGVVLLAHGLLKVFVFTLPGTVGFFESLGLPAIFAYLTTFGELGLGATLITGVMTRLSAIASLPILAGATWVHLGNGWVFNNQGGGWEFPALLLVIGVIVAIQGGGRLALSTQLFSNPRTILQ